MTNLVIKLQGTPENEPTTHAVMRNSGFSYSCWSQSALKVLVVISNVYQ